MPRIIGFTDSTFNADLYRQDASKNSGASLTTEGIIEGIDILIRDISDHPEDNWLTVMKDTSMYISPKKNN